MRMSEKLNYRVFSLNKLIFCSSDNVIESLSSVGVTNESLIVARKSCPLNFGSLSSLFHLHLYEKEGYFSFQVVFYFIFFFKKRNHNLQAQLFLQCAGCKILCMAPFVTGYTFLESYLKLIKFTYCCGLKQQCPDSSST